MGKDAKSKEKEGRQSIRREISCWIAAMRTHYLVLLIFTVIVYFPRLCLSFLVFILAQCLRLCARISGIETNRPVQNRRILVITDYLPPQTHGIAIRCAAYVKHMRAQGHEVVVFSTAHEAQKETSFDHPNVPAVVNPFNLNNRIGYNPGVKLAWFLGAHSWDVVHLFFPSLIGSFVLTVCAWRRIPVYCSHHVEMKMFAHEHVPFTPVCNFGLFMYNLIGKWPAIRWGTLNAAPTLVFARDHLGKEHEDTLCRVPSGTHDVFSPIMSSPSERDEVRSTRFGVQDNKTKVILMVQRLSGEKGTERIFPTMKPREGGIGSGTLEAVLAIAGDGPARASLEVEAKKRKLNVVFLGNVPHHDLPLLYRAADCFVTMSLSETFGLTCLEAMMCGCPGVVPRCAVFDEIWDERIPKTWRYNIDPKTGICDGLEAAIAAAQDGGREWLEKNPVKMTWKMAADELLEQYEKCIQLNMKKRQTLKEFVAVADHCLRIAICTLVAVWVLRKYYYRPLRRFMTQFGLDLIP
mmetsp:Transcript_54802/g.117009  ORF Transcript_54802/g.117009 Transcript_54802/m.117009 type:complete len:521 (-) Transcript_54802:111-1673(-)|eukprot:CAMPEP_0206452618 /NCGR_PEP_ID=MMETSP0324_2-20121206/20055_1 /ASSEMBLY_ACC=CAM_ASM_000836 /TAXON_ID=2866 /ORGANISM="Crypthecodinium cohnii, Strain Seligo" /LENGTH=520 /DNA_ID=CAMNT_0053922747 /DNA_START=131 /DNA_END=1693 /DNA_ORIENTATION=+